MYAHTNLAIGGALILVVSCIGLCAISVDAHVPRMGDSLNWRTTVDETTTASSNVVDIKPVPNYMYILMFVCGAGFLLVILLITVLFIIVTML